MSALILVSPLHPSTDDDLEVSGGTGARDGDIMMASLCWPCPSVSELSVLALPNCDIT